MFSGEALVYLVNIDGKTSNSDNGDKTRSVTSATGIVGIVDLVGIQTLQLGQSQGYNYSYSVEVPRLYYNYEKYCFFNNKLYEIRGVGKAKSHLNMLLNVCESNEKDVYDAIIKWLEA